MAARDELYECMYSRQQVGYNPVRLSVVDPDRAQLNREIVFFLASIRA